MSASNAQDEGPFLSCCFIKVKPGKMQEAFAAMDEVVEETRKEPGAKMYRYYKTEGKDELTCIEKFESRAAYAIHTSSPHVRVWAEKYYGPLSEIFDGEFEFHPAQDGNRAGGFDRP